MTEIKKAFLAMALGVLLSLVALVTYVATDATVSLAEILHAVADTLGICLLIFSQVRKKSSRLIVAPSRWLLGLAGALAMYFAVDGALRLLVYGPTPLSKPFWLIVASGCAMFIIWVQLLLTKDFHNALHGHSGKASYFFGERALAIKQVHENVMSELLADLAQTIPGLLVGIAALYGSDLLKVKAFDLFVSFLCGAYMLKRASTKKS